MKDAAKVPHLSNIADYTAQDELDPRAFSDYVLGRCLAIEEAIGAILRAMPPKKRVEVATRLQSSVDIGMSRLQEEFIEGMHDPRRHITKAGYVHALMMMGFSPATTSAEGSEAWPFPDDD